MYHNPKRDTIPDIPESATKIVVLGGGTGLSTVIKGLTSEPYSGESVTAVVSTFDSGGGTGTLRQVYPELPAVGDLRRNFAAMSRLSSDALCVLERRYAPGSESAELVVAGQAPGNLLIASAMQQIGSAKGNFGDALQAIAEIYQIKGSVVPVSNDVRMLRFTLPDGSIVKGEHHMEDNPIRSLLGTVISFDKTRTIISQQAEAAIREAGMVVLAPGDFYTSIGPNLVVEGMREALQAAPLVVLVLNLMNRGRHTVGFDSLTYVREYERLLGPGIIKHVVVNTAELDPESLAVQARRYDSHPVAPNVGGLRAAGYAVYEADILSRTPVVADPNDVIGAVRSLVLHDPIGVARALHDIFISHQTKL